MNLTALEIRNKILEKATKIDLNSILDFCWGNEIAVVHAKNLPKGKPDGLVFAIKNSPIIFLAQNDSVSKNTFNLAHELGHIFLEHLEGEEILQDLKIDFSSSASGKEKDANIFATELITGKKEFEFVKFYHLKAEDLASEKDSFEQKSKFDFGIALEIYAFQNKDSTFKPYPLIVKVQKLLGIFEGANKIINDKFLKNIDLDAFDDTTLSTLEQTLGINT